jgi:hypothetical protein|eukprot:3653352-Prymnesium_polylepis.2
MAARGAWQACRCALAAENGIVRSRSCTQQGEASVASGDGSKATRRGTVLKDVCRRGAGSTLLMTRLTASARRVANTAFFAVVTNGARAGALAARLASGIAKSPRGATIRQAGAARAPLADWASCTPCLGLHAGVWVEGAGSADVSCCARAALDAVVSDRANASAHGAGLARQVADPACSAWLWVSRTRRTPLAQRTLDAPCF